jgi:hypothetical protein
VQEEILRGVREEADQHADSGDRQLRDGKIITKHVCKASRELLGWPSSRVVDSAREREALTHPVPVRGSNDPRVWFLVSLHHHHHPLLDIYSANQLDRWPVDPLI